MRRRTFLRKMIGGCIATAGLSLTCSQPKKKPNFVFILLDDMGWHDLGCYGNPYNQSPNIDRLAEMGMKFTDAYAAAPVCSPTRASIMTGKYPHRVGVIDWIRPKSTDPEGQLPLSEVTIAEALKMLGYKSAHIGKWHLGSKERYPEKQGFDYNFAGTESGGLWRPHHYWFPYGYAPEEPLLKEGQGKKGEYMTDRLNQEAINFIEKNQESPFFLYLSHFAVHVKLQAHQSKIDKYKELAKQDKFEGNPIYAAMIESVDEGVGAILDKLEELDIADNTVVIFFSDNGGLGKVTSNKPLRSDKGSIYEGGIRVPLIIHWPGKTEPSSVCHIPVISNDFFPTLLSMAGIRIDPKWDLDGVDLTPLLKGAPRLKRDALYWYWPMARGNGPCRAIRKNEYKLIESYRDGQKELYDLNNDIGEEQNLFESKPEIASDLLTLLENWCKKTGAEAPMFS